MHGIQAGRLLQAFSQAAQHRRLSSCWDQAPHSRPAASLVLCRCGVSSLLCLQAKQLHVAHVPPTHRTGSPLAPMVRFLHAWPSRLESVGWRKPALVPAATVADRRARYGEQHRCRQGGMMLVLHTARVLVDRSAKMQQPMSCGQPHFWPGHAGYRLRRDQCCSYLVTQTRRTV